MKLASDHT